LPRLSVRGPPQQRAKYALTDTFTPELFASHLHDERFEIFTREILADSLQAPREIFSHAILSALTTLVVEVAQAQERSGAHSGQTF